MNIIFNQRGCAYIKALESIFRDDPVLNRNSRGDATIVHKHPQET